MKSWIIYILLFSVIPFLIGYLYRRFDSSQVIICISAVTFVHFLIVLYRIKPKRTNKRGDLFKDISPNEAVSLSVVVPAYNEELRLPKMLDETIDYLEARQTDKSRIKATESIYKSKDEFTYEIIIVDDGSSDATTLRGLEYSDKLGGDKIKVLTLKENLGKGGAVRAGFLAAKGKFIMFADADGASRFSDIEKLEDYMIANSETQGLVAVGSRAHMEAEAIASRSLIRTILMKGFHLLVWACCVRTIRDTQCGFKMFDRTSAKKLFSLYRTDSWAFDVELLHLAEHFGYKIGEIAIHWTEIDGSKIVPIFSWIRMGWDVLCISFFYSFGIYSRRIDS